MTHIRTLLLLSYLTFLSSIGIASAATEKRPNVIVIMADDISAKEFSAYNSSSRYGEWAKTPVLDRLADEGCFLSTSWASTVCMPTRAMIMSGRYAHITKWWDNGEFGKSPTGGSYQVPVSSPLMIGQIAQQAGYRSIWAGKTHVTTGSSYTKFGFDECIFTPGEPEVRGESPHEHFKNIKDEDFWNHHSYLWWPEVQLANHPKHPEGPDYWLKTEINDYGPDIELNYILEFMERTHKADKPFFVYHTSHLGHQAIDMADPEFPMTWPGTPEITWNPDTQSYTRATPRITANGPTNQMGTTYSLENITPNTLRSQIEYLDYQVWQYLEKLKEMGELENTIIMFLADNATKGWKASAIRQRGMHVPFIVYAPGEKKFAKGEQNIISDLTDVLPTLADVMGVQLPNQNEYELSGKSLWPYLTQQKDTHRDWIYSYKGKRQMVRGFHLLADGEGDWWDVSKTPSNLDSFPQITDFSQLTPEQKIEKSMIDDVLKRFAREDIGGPHSFHADPSMRISERELEKMRSKEEARQNHFKKMNGS